MSEQKPHSAPAWQEAVTLMDDLARATEAGAVLRAAIGAGLLERLVTPTSVNRLASVGGFDEVRLPAALEVLRQLDVVQSEGGAWFLTAAWAAVMNGESPVDLDPYVQGPRVRMAQFEHSLEGAQDYWALSPADRLVIARAVSLDPASPALAGMLRRDFGMLDGLTAALDAGGRVLELGCGVGSRLTATALAFPQAKCVGVELDSELAEYGRRRAASLGVADRVTYVAADAATFEPDGTFDLVSWSQFFFPSPSRAGAAATGWRALRPGGWLTTPVIWSADRTFRPHDNPQDFALEALNLSQSGIPAHTTDDVAAELRAAGFADMRVDDMGFIYLVRARK